MNYNEFRTEVKKYPVINILMLKILSGWDVNLKVNLTRWQKGGKIVRLRRGFYLLNADDRVINPSRMYLSRELYNPSYLSLEYALTWHGLIPERTTVLTCVTTKKTKMFENDLGRFTYQHIQEQAYHGFIEMKDEAGLTYFMATPEKATVDFLYLNQKRFQSEAKAVLKESFRFQNTENLNREKLKQYAEQFKNRKVKQLIAALQEL